jgi:hypothetical protein
MDSVQESPCLSVASKKEGRRDGYAERTVVVGLYGHDDFDLLTALGTQAASALLAAHRAEELAHAR